MSSAHPLTLRRLQAIDFALTYTLTSFQGEPDSLKAYFGPPDDLHSAQQWVNDEIRDRERRAAQVQR